MTGHVFHSGHHPLHGVTVIIESTGPATYVGRFDSEDETGFHLLQVAIHREGVNELAREAYLSRTMKFGVRTDCDHILVPRSEVRKITRLTDYQPGGELGVS